MNEYNYKNVYSNSEKKTNPIKKEHPTSKLQVPRDKKLRKKKSAQSTYYIGQKMKNYRVSKRLATIKDKDKRSKSDEIVKRNESPRLGVVPGPVHTPLTSSAPTFAGKPTKVKPGVLRRVASRYFFLYGAYCCLVYAGLSRSVAKLFVY